MPAPLWPGHQLRWPGLPAWSPDPPRKLDGAWGGGRLGGGGGCSLKEPSEGALRSPGFSPSPGLAGAGVERRCRRSSGGVWEGSQCSVASQTSRAQKRQWQVSVEGRREVGVLVWDGSGSCGTGQGLGGSDLERALAVVPLARGRPRALPHARAPVPSTCPASCGNDVVHCSQSLAPRKGSRGRAVAQRWRGSKMGKPEGEGRGGRGAKAAEAQRGVGSSPEVGVRGCLRPLALPRLDSSWV